MSDPFGQAGKYPQRVAVIDLGSNSLKMVCYSADYTGTYRPYHRESSRIRLDEYGDGVIGEESIDRLIDALFWLRNIVQYEDVGRVLPVATSAVRGAENRESLVSRIAAETGFDFSVLSGDQEALYSYAGAACNLNMPSSIFFDLGGGSMEIVSARNYAVTRALSLPLGALVMTRKFAGDGDFDADSISRLRQYVQTALPTMESLGPLGNGAMLVGVGGTLRAVAKYVQERAEYPLKKLHNYFVDADSLKAAADAILSKDVKDLANMYEIGRGRADIMKAGIITISEMASKYNLGGIRVCSTGLREGVLAMASRYTGFGADTISPYLVRELVRAPPGTPRIPYPVSRLVSSLDSSGLLSGEERLVLQMSATHLERLRTFRDADDFVYRMMDMPSTLSHRQQLLGILCLAYSKKPKRTKLLMKRYGALLDGDDEQTIKRLSRVMDVCDLMLTAGAEPDLNLEAGLSLTVRRRLRPLPDIMLEQKCSSMANALGVAVAQKTASEQAP